jgi:hypothetical protein
MAFTPRALKLCAVAGALLPLSCSLLVDFDPEGKPCDTEGECRSGYACVEGKCLRRSLPTDGGTPGAPDAGAKLDECGGKCTAEQKCLKTRKECAEGCEGLLCPAGSACVKGSDGAAQCVLVDKSIGARCTADSECATVGATKLFCLLSSVTASDGKRFGFCTFKCADPDTTCSTAGVPAACFSFNDSELRPQRLCVRTLPAAASKPAVFSCRNDLECADFGPGACALFDHKPAAGSAPSVDAPFLLCDVRRESGVSEGTCTPTPSNATNGLCLPGHPFSASAAARPCGASSDCPAGHVCAKAEFARPGFAPRRVDLCVKKQTRCEKCTDDDKCGADAPHCIEVKTGDKRCVTECKTLNNKIYGCEDRATCKTFGALLSACIPADPCP